MPLLERNVVEGGDELSSCVLEVEAEVLLEEGALLHVGVRGHVVGCC